jgi:hypothetical protein
VSTISQIRVLCKTISGIGANFSSHLAVLVSAALNAASAAAEMMDPPVPPVPLVAVVQVGEASNGRGLSLIRNSAGLEFATIVALAFFLYSSSMYYNVLAWPDL